MTKLVSAITAAVLLLLGAPLLMAALIVTGSTATATQLDTCTAVGAPPSGSWRPPYQQAYVVGARGFGMRFHPILRTWRPHTGQDMTSIPTGGAIVAAATGTVTFAGDSGGYGNLVLIDHGGGITTAYAHLARIDPAITVGANASMGQRLGTEGSTGRSTGNHLHYEVRQNGTPIDPVPFMANQGAPLDGRPIAPTARASESPASSADSVIAAARSFELPEPGEPRLNSITNPALPIPPEIKALYAVAAERYDLPWTLLAGIGMAETAHGRIRATSTAGAQGLMQFMPATWRIYGVDGDGDGRADILNDADSTMSAANYLTASRVHNGPDGVRDALFAYNRAHWYVNDVLQYAESYGGGAVTAARDCRRT
ncbi:peptidoglycan DD-metalloendopeptidase family protein [Nostocoides sp. F2B08]|uniref:peptidoglycan DD-metalloendopeptidase family protein n=1 Tax=Nostocoides sp. F2B08 TaxID=2653936 RepID=UPI001263A17B|nr:peptidoglycan DD-metalloendopeptidase family protein [Tetrasphaera sp. F2B08]KAB7740040.1 peptidoglycan DD-metalloendopeptidase family protein [Tetrasphaera sp. F2B08]